ncbi:MAG TPA: hypothetical protein VGO78_13095 [Acidimicrobiales bacterium]|nr:hypothetical protein [Acidimicrobiales bacterium]
MVSKRVTRAHSAAMCAAGTAQPSPDLAATYGGETNEGLDELVGSATLDPAITDPGQRNHAATDAVWAQWQDDPTLVDARWDELGVGEVACPDGRLYLSAALRQDPSMPVGEDPTPGGPLAAFTPRIAAAVSTGAHLTPGLDLVDLQPTDSPVMMFHFEQDTSRYHATWDYAYQTCAAIHTVGNVCDSIRLPGSGHTVGVGPTGKWRAPEIGPFLWHHLDLAS